MKRTLVVPLVVLLLIAVFSVAVSEVTCEQRSYSASMTCARRVLTGAYVATGTQHAECTGDHDMTHGTKVRVFAANNLDLTGWRPSSGYYATYSIELPYNNVPLPVRAEGKFAARCSEGLNFTVITRSDSWS